MNKKMINSSLREVTISLRSEMEYKINPSNLWGITTEELDKVEALRDEKGVKFLYVGKEQYPSRPEDVHYHAIVWFKYAKKFEWLKERIPRGKLHNVDWGWLDYCSKDHMCAVEYGNRPKQGKRGDLVQFALDCTDPDMTWEKMKIKHFSIIFRYTKALSVYLDNRPAPKLPRVTKVFMGAPGTGKTKTAWELMPNAYIKMPGKWFEGYEGQKDVIIDDFRGEKDITLSLFLMITDPYSKRVRLEIKGSSVPWLAERVIITTNVNYNKWYPEDPTDPDRLKAIRRRLEEVQYFF